jgi:hypothetical protein
MNLIDEILQDHESTKRLFTAIAVATGEERIRLFDELRENLIRHEVAEEEIVRPMTKKSVPGGEEIADQRIAEESEAEGILRQMEKADVGSDDWNVLFERLRSGVLEHAQHEETLELPQLRMHVSPEELDQKGTTYESAKRMAPTHPHPMTPNTPLANMTLGPVAAVLDRARDAVNKAMHSSKAS